MRAIQVMPLLLALVLIPTGAGPAEPTTNLLMISLDTLRPDHLASHGYSRHTSPYLDSLARTSVRFARAYSTSSWTLPAHYSVLTGRFPATPVLFAYAAKAPFSADEVTLAEHLRSAGWETAAFVGGGLMSSHWGFDQGFETYASSGGTLRDNHAAMVEWAEVHDRARPFFLLVHGYDVHEPHTPPAAIRDRFLEEPVPAACRGVVPRGDGSDAACLRAPGAAAYVAAQYDAQIFAADRRLGRTLKALKRRGLLERTVVIVLSDHGEELLERGHVGHARTLHEEVLRVVLVLRRPGRRGRRVETPVSLLDVMPTVLDLLNVTPPPGMHGTSLVPLLDDGSPGSPVFAVSGLATDAWTYASLHDGHKLLSERRRGGWAHRLYDLTADPAEQRDLVASGAAPAVLSEARRRQRAWARRVGLVLDDQTPPPSHVVPPDLREQLRALGYAE